MDDRITLASISGAPFGFQVKIAVGGATGAPARTFSVVGPDPTTGSLKEREYRITKVEHGPYLDFFQTLSQDFGTRLPRNRRPPAEPGFHFRYRALLTENIDPRIRYGYGDPAVIRVGCEDPWYYLLVTSNDAPNSFPIIRSRDLKAWKLAGFVFPEGLQPVWAADGAYVSDYWAPEMHLVGGEFRVYFAARRKGTNELSIGIAKSTSPYGPFAAEDEPLLLGNVIDPHVFVEADGSAILFWKEDNNDIWPSLLARLLHEHSSLIGELFPEREDQVTASLIQTLWPWVQGLQPIERFFVQQILIEAVISSFSAFRARLGDLLGREGFPPGLYENVRAVLGAMRTPVYAQRLSADGLGLVGDRIKVIENDQAWEAHLIEGMWVAEYGRKYYLFYTGNDFSTTDYGIGVAIGDSPLGPYRKMAEPLLGSTKDWSGPGHPSVAFGPDGKPLLFFHAYFPGQTGYKEFRALLAAQIEFKQNRVLLT